MEPIIVDSAPTPPLSKWKHFPWFSMVTGLLITTGLIVGLILVGNSQNYKKQASSDMVDISIVPQTKTVGPDENFPIDLLINTNDKAVSALTVELNFDPNLVEITNVTPNALSKTVRSLEINGNSATFTLASNCDANGCTPFTGSGILATVSFHAKSGVGESTLTLGSKTQAASTGTVGNTLGTISNGNIIIQTNTSPTIQPSATPTVNATCQSLCQSQNYATGTCRNNPNACNKNNETYNGAGDVFCTQKPQNDSCCCK
jgi:hypothetical protein